jgi:L-rhamnose-H+ transport protein
VWSVFIVGACLVLPAVIVTGMAPASWGILVHAPRGAVLIALGTGFAWGFGAIMFGQSVSAIGIALANTFVLAVSSALGSLLPMLFLTPARLHERAGMTLLLGIAVEIVGIALCGRAGIWVLMLGGGAVSNLGFCVYLLSKNRTATKFSQPGSSRLYLLAGVMALLWGGSIFVYGAAAPRLGELGASIGWPLSLATGLLVANAVGLTLGEWKGSPKQARGWMFAGIAVLLVAIGVLSRAG